ncbi:MAG: rhodanese-like domain-containing protein [Robiginitomaculum sp.]|nr:rhodanese-like domain-containing protein [Robiginitomaculum sp.]
MTITHVNAQQAHALLKARPETVVLDLRTGEEFEMFYIKDAVNLDCQSDFFARRLKALRRTVAYLVHCHSGDRSTKALAQFKALGFTNITHMDGGLRAWMHADLPLISNWSI